MYIAGVNKTSGSCRMLKDFYPDVLCALPPPYFIGVFYFMYRKKIKPNERLLLFEQHDFMCKKCKFQFDVPKNYNGKLTLQKNGIWLEIDHIKPISKGGSDVFENKQPLCNLCNSKKYNHEWLD